MHVRRARDVEWGTMMTNRLPMIICLLAVSASVSFAEDPPAVVALVAGLETTADAYTSGQFQFRTCSPGLRHNKNTAAMEKAYRIVDGTYYWNGESKRIEYREWSSADSKLNLQEPPVPGDALTRTYVEDRGRSYHWLVDETLLVISESGTGIKPPEWIQVGPSDFWFTFDGQFRLDYLLSKSLPPGHARWVVFDRDEIVRIGMGGVDRSQFYEFSFLARGDYVIPTGYSIQGSGSSGSKVLHSADLQWQSDSGIPIPMRASFARGTSKEEIEEPRLAMVFGPLSMLSQNESHFKFSDSVVPPGTQVQHHQRSGQPPRTHWKGGRKPKEMITEDDLKEIAEKVRGR